jgi:hypothetical protein
MNNTMSAAREAIAEIAEAREDCLRKMFEGHVRYNMQVTNLIYTAVMKDDKNDTRSITRKARRPKI